MTLATAPTLADFDRLLETQEALLPPLFLADDDLDDDDPHAWWNHPGELACLVLR